MRIRTLGFEAQGFSSNDPKYTRYFEGFTAGAVTSDATIARLGIGRSLKCDSTGGNAVACSRIFIDPSVQDGGAWTRCYFYFASALPSADCQIMQFLNGSSAPLISARLTSAGKLQLWNETGTPAQIGSDSAATLVADTWYRIELKDHSVAGASDSVELRLGGVSVASATLSLSDLDAVDIQVGWVSAPGASRVCYVDDLGSNDNTGSDQTSWPGDGKVVLLLPISDAQVGSWTGGAGGTTNLWEAINNTPPVGTDSQTDTSQIENVVSEGGTSYIANMATYSSAGITLDDTITVVQLMVDCAEDSATGTKLGTQKIASNPTAGTALFMQFGSVISGGALGVWPVLWGINPALPGVDGNLIYSPSVTLGTSPTVEIDRTSSGATIASVDFVGLYVEYVPVEAGALAGTATLLFSGSATLSGAGGVAGTVTLSLSDSGTVLINA